MVNNDEGCGNSQKLYNNWLKRYDRTRSTSCRCSVATATEFAASFAVDPNCFRESFRQCWLDSSSHVVVAIVKSSLAGYLLGFDHVAFFVNGRVAGVEEIYVCPSHRGRGIGRVIMKKFERWAKSRGSAQVVVCTRRTSGFYSALGYEETATCFRRLERDFGKAAADGGPNGAVHPKHCYIMRHSDS